VPAHSPVPALDGIIAVPATPFTDDNRVDVQSLRRYAREVIAHGVVGFLAPAVAGEVDVLTDSERELIVATLLEESAGRVPVIGGATDPEPAARLRHAKRFLEMGCHGVLAHLPYEHNDAAISDAVHALGDLNSPLLMIQDLDWTGGSLPIPLIARLHREVPSFSWIKIETADRCRKISAVLEATGGSLRVGTAGPDMIELLDRGVHAFLITYATAAYARIWRHHRAGGRAEAIALYRRLLPCLAFMATHQNIQWRFTKAMLQAEGIFTTTRVRKHVPELDPIEQQLVADLAAYGKQLCASFAFERDAAASARVHTSSSSFNAPQNRSRGQSIV
jgi:dihydrodipicolinate synthase/N-acetylneuraminate lyase